jgi:hypothetical protein
MRIFINDHSPQKKREKGVFGFAKLPAAIQYLFPEKQIFYLKIAGIIGATLFLFWLIDIFFRQGRATSAGPISSVHANFESDCSKCHDIFANASDAKCSICHEKAIRKDKQFGTYSFAAHYVYRSSDSIRAQTMRTKFQEQPCRSCHTEHKGRDHKIAAIDDAQCLPCHYFDSFTSKHPEFDFIRENVPDDSALAFTHIKHMRETLKFIKARDTEHACLFCHNPNMDGKLFQSISYDRHCMQCHLKNIDTPPLPIATKWQTGVFDLATIRNNPSIATLWADSYDPTSFEFKPGMRIVKKRVTHKDTWVIYNLNQLRKATDLSELTQSANEPNGFSNAQSQMRMALQSLAGSSNAELQNQIAIADSMLMQLNVSDRQLISGDTLSAETASIVQKLSQPCHECHTVRNGAILWVNGRQNQLVRANFNHRAHIVQRKCLDCHTRIAINAMGADSIKALRNDRSAVQNLPDKTECVKCHNGNETTQRCITCHEFHL